MATTHPSPTTMGRPRVRHRLRDAAALMAFSLGFSGLLALALTVLTWFATRAAQ